MVHDLFGLEITQKRRRNNYKGKFETEHEIIHAIKI